MPGAAERWCVERGILLWADRSAFHVRAHERAFSLLAVRNGKQPGVLRPCEVAPHHFTLTDEPSRAPSAYDIHTKMNPPAPSRGSATHARRALYGVGGRDCHGP